MKRKSTVVILLLIAVLLNGCSKDDKDSKTITNLSGVTWYKAQVWFRSSPDGDLNGYKDVGTVDVGESCTVDTDEPYFYIYAKDARGKLIMSETISFAGRKATVTSKDLL